MLGELTQSRPRDSGLWKGASEFKWFIVREISGTPDRGGIVNHSEINLTSGAAKRDDGQVLAIAEITHREFELLATRHSAARRSRPSLESPPRRRPFVERLSWSPPEQMRVGPRVVVPGGCCVLVQLVPERRDPNRPRLALTLRDVDASDRLVPITPRPQPRVQVLKPYFQGLPVLLLRHPIHADSRILAHAVVGSSQGRHINKVCQ